MSPRHYRSDRRKAATEQTRQRIVDSTVRLHAEHGAMATTYAMIAKDADVAIPTVYNHFPQIGDLLGACTGQAATLAPAIGPEIFDGAVDLDNRLTALVTALFEQYEFYAPWMRWTEYEAQVFPELAAWLEKATALRRQLIKKAVTPAFPKSPPQSLLTLLDILTGFSAWRQLTDDGKKSGGRAKTNLVNALMALVSVHASPSKRSLS